MKLVYKIAATFVMTAAVVFSTGCGEQRVNSDGKAWLADRPEMRPAPTDPDNHLLADMQSDIDAGPLSWSR